MKQSATTGHYGNWRLPGTPFSSPNDGETLGFMKALITPDDVHPQFTMVARKAAR